MSAPSPSLVSWTQQALADYLPENQQHQPLRWQNLSGDAGFRQYYRLNTVPPLLAVVAPPATEDSRAFVAIADYLREHGVRTPRVVAFNEDEGLLLVEDLGTDLLLDHLNADSADLLYGEVLMTLLRLQQLEPDPKIFPPYSREKLRRELEVFNEWFVGALLKYELNHEEQRLLDDLYNRLEASALEQPQVIVHRDFHARNLVHSPGNAPGIIDFQDAVVGPITYDLVSLLRDCYIQWPVEKVRRWALAYADIAADVELLQQHDPEVFLRHFDWMGLQRHIKVLGVFARLSLRDNKHGYLKDLPLVLHYVRSVAAQYPELEAFSSWFDRKLLPLAQKQAWFRPVEAL